MSKLTQTYQFARTCMGSVDYYINSTLVHTGEYIVQNLLHSECNLTCYQYIVEACWFLSCHYLQVVKYQTSFCLFA